MTRPVAASACRVIACSGLLLGCTSTPEPGEVYYLVTHGPTTDIGFWGEVYAGADELATTLEVTLEPLHPVVQSSSDELSAQMAHAVGAAPTGIIATIWGPGMADEVRAANLAGVPVAAINVYPDAAEYGPLGLDGSAPPGQAGFLLYAGQDDAFASALATRALVCHAGADTPLDDDETCGGTPLPAAWAALTRDATVQAVCIVHQDSAGVLTRCEAMEQVLTEDFGLPAAAFVRVSWDESIPDGGLVALTDHFRAPAQQEVDRFIVMALGQNGVRSYVGADVAAAVRARVTLGTFDTSALICGELAAGRIAFATTQGHRDQARMALAYLHHYVHSDQTLPDEGLGPDGSPEPRWTSSADGYRWFRTGPQLVTSCSP